MMVSIGNKINNFCSMCAKEKEDVRPITLYVQGNREAYNRIFLCENHLKQVAETIDFLFDDGSEEADPAVDGTVREEQIVPNWNDTDKCYCCGKCGKAIVFLWRKYDGYRENYKYCHSCGQAVKWE